MDPENREVVCRVWGKVPTAEMGVESRSDLPDLKSSKVDFKKSIGKVRYPTLTSTPKVDC